MEEYTPSPEVLAEVPSLKEKGVAFPRGAGCKKCDGLGFIGRMPVAELMIVGEALEQFILEGAPVREIELAARKAGMKTMWEDGLDRVVEGTLSPDELVRVVPKPVSEWGGADFRVS
jgi:type II secretory ATPase GspE/PulE/Tfp pilus assembly ATPase PilB-like protein